MKHPIPDAIRKTIYSRGFTIVELMISILIIGLLANLTLPTYRNEVEKSRLSELVLQIDGFQDALQIMQEADGINLLRKTSFNLNDESTIAPYLKDVVGRFDFNYDNLKMLYMQEISGNTILGVNIFIMPVGDAGRRSIENLSEILPQNYFKRTGPFLIIPMTKY